MKSATIIALIWISSVVLALPILYLTLVYMGGDTERHGLAKSVLILATTLFFAAPMRLPRGRRTIFVIWAASVFVLGPLYYLTLAHIFEDDASVALTKSIAIAATMAAVSTWMRQIERA